MGCINGGGEALVVEGSRVSLEWIRAYGNLWDDRSKTACNADIDVLAIGSALNKEIENYDWAISAVVTTLINDPTRPRDYLKRVPMILKGTPPL